MTAVEFRGLDSIRSTCNWRILHFCPVETNARDIFCPNAMCTFDHVTPGAEVSVSSSFYFVAVARSPGSAARKNCALRVAKSSLEIKNRASDNNPTMSQLHALFVNAPSTLLHVNPVRSPLNGPISAAAKLYSVCSVRSSYAPLSV